MQRSAALPARASALPSLSTITPYLLWTLLVAGLTELLLFRTLSRVGVHIPKEGLALRVYDGLVSTGSYAFNVSSATAFLAVGLLAYGAYRAAAGRRPLLAAAAALMLALTAVSLLLAFAGEGASTRLAYGLLAAGIMAALAIGAWNDRRRDPWRALAVVLVVLAYAGSLYHVLANEAYQALGLTARPPATLRALEAAEALVLVAAGVAFWRWSGVRVRGWTGPRRWRPALLQAGVAVALVAVFVASYYGRGGSSTAAILSLWSLGLTLYLPMPLYALALGLYGAAVAGALRRHASGDDHPWDAIALGLLPVAGLTLELTYQYLVALVALLVLVRPLHLEGAARPRSMAPPGAPLSPP